MSKQRMNPKQAQGYLTYLEKRVIEIEEQLDTKQTEIDRLTALVQENREVYEVLRDAAQDLYDNRLGWSDGRNPYVPPEFWERLKQALSGEK